MKRVTIKDVAKRANVSTATVSRVVNGIGTVTDDNRDKVQTAIKELNYFVNTTASNLKKNSSNVIGIVIPTFTNEYFMELIKGIEDSFVYSEYVFYIASSKDDLDKEKEILQKFRESNVEGVILLTIGGNESFIQELLKMNMKIISVERRVEIDGGIDFIGENNVEAAYELTKKFLSEIPYRDVVLLGGYEELSIGHERIEGAVKALQEKEQEYTYINGHFNAKISEEIFPDIVTRYPNGCGIISLNNTMTEGVIRAIHRDEEKDYSSKYPVASYGKIKFQSIFKNNIIASVRQYPYQIGVEVSNRLQNKIDGNASETVTKLIRNTID